MTESNGAPQRPSINRINIVLDCDDPGSLALFYSQFLGWELTHPAAGGWAAVTSPAGSVMAFQQVPGYQAPVWPQEPGKPGQMLHLDYWVDYLEEGVNWALSCGARLAEQQFYSTSRTLLDPAGHPFCIDTEGEEAD